MSTTTVDLGFDKWTPRADEIAVFNSRDDLSIVPNANITLSGPFIAIAQELCIIAGISITVLPAAQVKYFDKVPQRRQRGPVS